MRTGDTIGRWRLISRLGAGGNADVWRAECDGEIAAVKVLRSRSAASEQYARFRQEVAALERLRDVPGILPLIEYHLPERPTKLDPAWLAMPVAMPITEALGPEASLERIVTAVADVADALTKAATINVHHRDIKPQNLYVFDEHACVGDFGLAAIPDRAALTADGRKLGPMWYLAPEMLNYANSADPAPADVYSLGKTLWVLVSGQAYPFPGEMADSSLRLSNYAGDSRTPFLDHLVMRSCAHAPSSRPTIGDLANELRAFLAIQSGHDAPMPQPALTSRFAMLRRSLTAVEGEHKRLIQLREELHRRLSSAANLLVDTTKGTTGFDAELSSENHIGTLLRTADLGAPQASTRGAIVLVRAPRPLGAEELLFFGGYSLALTHGGSVGVDAAFGLRGPEKILGESRLVGLLGTAELEVGVARLERWATENLPVALAAFADALDARSEKLRRGR
jgi:serine/threonine protein kinase